MLAILFSRNRLLVVLREYPPAFGDKLVSLFHEFLSGKQGMPQVPERVPHAAQVWLEMGFEDIWEEAKMAKHWLRGGKDLRIPVEFRTLLPTRI